MANRLAHETSPYLLQHRDNPVDWWPWGPAALSAARERDVPLLISIGYSACHWCHVMERESFEDAAIAAFMNDHFVCIKVDREERPDIDGIYMDAVQAIAGHGGWPLNAFATPEQVPFYAGTYFPPEPRHGLPSWRQVLEAIADAWATRRDEIRAQAPRMAAHLDVAARLRPTDAPVDPGLLDDAVAAAEANADPVHGGFGGAPKFPQPATVELLLRRGAHGPALAALRAMARGGIYDQLGGGFARYAVDAAWVVPHFEKMLYDNALLARAYLHGWQVSGDAALRRVAQETLDWALREMRGPEGGFYAALDADSEGVEGRYYVWTLDELRTALDDDALLADAIAWYGATAEGDLEGANVLRHAQPLDAPPPPRLPEIRARLLAARARRVRPGLDDKRLTAWNGLMIAALAEAGAVLDRRDYLDAARRAADFVLTQLRGGDGRLRRSWKDGRTALAGYLDDHAFMVEALLTLYEATFEPRWFAAARALADTMIARFGDRERGGFYLTADDHEPLVVRRKPLEDHPIPSGNASAALGLLRLARLTGVGEYERWAEGVIRLLHPLAASQPHAFGHLLAAIDFWQAPVREVAIVGPAAEAAALARVVRGAYRPNVVVAGALDGEQLDGAVELLAGRTPVDGRAAAYVCERFACQRPVIEPGALAAALG